MTSSSVAGTFRARRLVSMALTLALAGAGPAAAQTLFQGGIDVTVQDAQERSVPGAAVEIAGPATQQQTSDANGEAHFLNLAPGIYVVTVALQGFTTYRNETVRVGGGSSVPLRATLQVGGISETVQVNREAPIVDPGRQTVTTGVSYEELQQLPSARDPWVILQTVPGVVVDRVNVGGAESGQQSNYIAKGAGLAENTWNIDGIPVTDLAATGSSPTYYNFDMFQEMSVTTGGASATNPTPGAQLNMQFKTGSNTLLNTIFSYAAGDGLVTNEQPNIQLPPGANTLYAAAGPFTTYFNSGIYPLLNVISGCAPGVGLVADAQLNMQFKTGSNTLSGTAHFYGAGENLQSTNLPDELLPLAGPSGKGNRMQDLTDFGFDLGGPIVRNKWWAWGSYGRTDSTLFTLNGDPDATKLENIAFKTSAQLTTAIRPEFLFFRGNKVKNGRGASPLRAPETTWDQTGPTPLYKGQVNIVAKNNVFLTARGAYVGNGFSLTPQD